MTARVQMEQVKLDKFNLKGMKSTEDQSTTYVLIQSFIKQLTLVVKQCFFYACSKSNCLQLCPEAAIILQFLHCLGNVTSWNIRQYTLDNQVRICCLKNFLHTPNFFNCPILVNVHLKETFTWILFTCKPKTAANISYCNCVLYAQLAGC